MAKQRDKKGAQPDGSQETWAQVKSLLEYGRYREVEAPCRQALDTGATGAKWNIALALSLLNTERASESLTFARAAADSSPNHPQVYRILARVYSALGDGQRALDTAAFAFRLLPNVDNRNLLRQIQNQFQDGVSVPTQEESSELGWEEDAGDDADGEARLHLLQATAEQVSDHDHEGQSALVDKQVESLFGGSMFGAWEDPGELLSSERSGPRSGKVTRRIVVLALILVLGAAIAWVIREGLQRRQAKQQVRMAQEVHAFLAIGDLERVAAFLPEFCAHRDSASWSTADEQLSLRAEASLYRFHDADAERVHRVKQSAVQLGKDLGYDGQVGLALLLSDTERVAWVPKLKRLDSPDNRDPEAAYLLAMALVRAGADSAAEQAFKRSADLGPSIAYHLAAEADFQGGRGNVNGAHLVLEVLADESPYSPWTRVARINHSLLTSDPFPDLAKGKDTLKSPVAEAAENFSLALRALREKNSSLALSWLDKAVAEVNGQSPFLLDFFDRLFGAGHLPAARHLLALKSWPQELPAAQAALGSLYYAEGHLDKAGPLLAAAWQKEIRDARTGDHLVQTILTTGKPDLPLEEMLTELLERWPEQLPLELSYAQLLHQAGKVDQAADYLRKRWQRIRKSPSGLLKSKALLLLARVELSHGNKIRARSLLANAVKNNSQNEQASQLLAQIDAELKIEQKKSRRSNRKKKRNRKKLPRSRRRPSGR